MKNNQLEFESVVEELTDFQLLNKKLDETIESLRKVQKKLFAEVGKINTLLAFLQAENESLQSQLSEMKGDKIEFDYTQKDGFLFDILEA